MKSSLLFQYALSLSPFCGYRREILILAALCLSVSPGSYLPGAIFQHPNATPSDSAQTEEKYIKWVDFSVPDEALRQAPSGCRQLYI